MNPAHSQTAAPRPQALQAEGTRIPHNQRQPGDWARLNPLMDQVERALAHDPAP